jgi:hypothetical protein
MKNLKVHRELRISQMMIKMMKSRKNKEHHRDSRCYRCKLVCHLWSTILKRPKNQFRNFSPVVSSVASNLITRILKSSQSLICLLRPSILKVTPYFDFNSLCIASSQYSLTDLKKTLLEMKIQGQINDTIKQCNGYVFKIKGGDGT